MSRQDFKDIKKAFKEAANTLDATLDEFQNNHDLSKSLGLSITSCRVEKKKQIAERAKGEI